MEYFIATLKPAPSMNKTEISLGECTYEEAKEAARQWVKANKRPASVHIKAQCTYAWARYDGEGNLSWDKMAK